MNSKESTSSTVSFPLPGTGYEQLRKVLKGYAKCGRNPVAPPDVEKYSGVSAEDVSRNGKFLVSLSILTEGRKKQLTALGRELAVAIANDNLIDEQRLWQPFLTANENLQSVFSQIEIQGALSKDDLVKRIAQIARLAIDPRTNTTINSLITLLEKQAILVLTDGKYHLNDTVTPSSPSTSSELPDLSNASKTVAPIPTRPQPISNAAAIIDKPKEPSIDIAPGIFINLQIHIASDTTEEKIKLIFSSMREYLFHK